MKILRIIIIALLFITTEFSSNANESIRITDLKKKLLIGNSIEYIEDKENALDIKDVITNNTFSKSSSSVLNFGTTKSTYWLKISAKNLSGEKIYLEIQNPLIDFAQIYIIKGNTIEHTYTVDENEIFSKRPFLDKNIIFDVAAEKDTSTKTVYLKVRSSEHLSLPIFFSSINNIIEYQNDYNLLFGIYIGIILAMFFYNLFLYTSIKDSSYLYYITYIICVGLAQVSLKGYSFEYIFPNIPFLANRSALIFSSFTGIFALLFIRNFLLTKTFTPKLDRILLSIMGIYVLSLALAILDFKRMSCVLIDIGGLSASSVIIYTCIRIINLGYNPAKYFLYSWSLFLASILIFVFKDFGLISFNIITDNIIEIGSALEVTVLSLALADRINILKKEKEESQAQALDALLQNELIIRNQNIVLENRVEERTKKLKFINEELSNTLSELKQTQSQLVNSEKMASLGQLTAGIAHEINNPINFVVSNVKPLNRDIEDIYELIHRYDNINIDESDTINKIKDVRKYREEIDYEYLKQEIGHMLKGIEDGAVRTADIVKGLRIFSRLDENDLKRTDITEGISATLTLLNPEITGSIELVKNFSSIPKIECFPGKLNQVFMNILNNAIYAIKENIQRSEKGKLEITTTFDDSFVYIAIKDNGIGMSDDIRKKIFDPFFTTKPVGKGTGLGMSITFSIIKDHHGTMDLFTENGVGSEFIIKLPIDYKNE